MCPYHDWGSDFDFAELNKAASRCAKLYERFSGQCVMWKEKYGTIRYEYEYLWLKSNEDVELFCKILKFIVNKHPTVAGELVSDWCVTIDHPYWTPFFKGVLWASSGSEWK